MLPLAALLLAPLLGAPTCPLLTLEGEREVDGDHYCVVVQVQDGSPTDACVRIFDAQVPDVGPVEVPGPCLR